jgi:hypothetical protein
MEETFGPVVGIMKVESDDEALALMNDSPYGLVSLSCKRLTCNGTDDSLSDRLNMDIAYIAISTHSIQSFRRGTRMRNGLPESSRCAGTFVTLDWSQRFWKRYQSEYTRI